MSTYTFFTGTDPVASVVARQPLPDLSAVSNQQPARLDGAWLHGAAVELLGKMAEGFKPGRLQRRTYGPHLEALEEAGLILGTEPTDQGRIMATIMAEPEANFRISAAREGQQVLFQCWVARELALVIAQAGPAARNADPAADAPGPEYFNVRLHPLLDLSTEMATWVGLAPAWNLDPHPAVLPLALIDAQMSSERPAPPAGANEVLQDMWNQQWTYWSLAGACPSHELDPLTYVSCGRRGQYRVAGTETDAVRLLPAASSHVFDQIEDRIQAMVFDRRITLP